MFVGTATLDGRPAAAGVTVTAVVDGVTAATVTTGSGGSYIIYVAQPEDASYEGKLVTFDIGTARATQTATWSLGAATILNLAAVSAPPSTPTPTPTSAAPRELRELVAAIVRALNPEDWNSMRNIRTAVGLGRAAAPVFRELLPSQDFVSRWAAVYCFSALASPEDIPSLVPTLNDPILCTRQVDW